MGGRQHHHRHGGVARFFLGHGNADRGVRIDEVAGLAPHCAHGRGDFLLVGAIGGEQSADVRQRPRRQRKTPRLRQRSHQRAHRVGVAVIGVEDEPLEIRRDLDIHRRRGGRHHVAQFVGAGRERARQDIVDVGGDDQPIDRQAQPLRYIAGVDVAEVSGRNGEGDLAMRRAERHRGGEVIDRLRHYARPVDRVDAGKPHPVAKGGMIEQALHDRLAVVEGAVDGDCVDIGGVRRRHHAPLHLRDAALRKQHDDVDLMTAAERFDGGAAGVARGRHHDCAALAARGEHVIHQPRQKLHRQILEGERRAVEQFERKGIRTELGERRHRGMAEIAVGLARHAGEVRFADGIADERPHHLDGDFGIGPSGEACDGRRIELRPGLGHIKAAVAGKAREHHLGEAENWGFASRRDVTQPTPFCRPGRARKAELNR